jgi:hypothetical protein
MQTVQKTCAFIFTLGLYFALAPSAAAQGNTVVSSFTISGGPLIGATFQTASASIQIQRALNDNGDDFVYVSANGPVVVTCPVMSSGFCVIPAGASNSTGVVTAGWTSQSVDVTVTARVYFWYGDPGQTADVTVVPPTISVSVSPNSIVGASAQTATANLTVNAAPNGPLVRLIGDPQVATPQPGKLDSGGGTTTTLAVAVSAGLVPVAAVTTTLLGTVGVLAVKVKVPVPLAGTVTPPGKIT